MLQTRKGWNTSELPVEIAQAAGIIPNGDGRYQAGLFAAWQLAARHAGDDMREFVERQGAPMFDHVKRRNLSILAHGHTPVSSQDWAAFAGWLAQCFEPLLRALLARERIREPFPQLPDRYPQEFLQP